MTQLDALARYELIELPIIRGEFRGGTIEANYGENYRMSATVLGVDVVLGQPFLPQRAGALHDLVYEIDPETLEGDPVPGVLSRPEPNLLTHPFQNMGQLDVRSARNYRRLDYFLGSMFNPVRVVYNLPELAPAQAD